MHINNVWVVTNTGHRTLVPIYTDHYFSCLSIVYSTDNYCRKKCFLYFSPFKEQIFKK